MKDLILNVVGWPLRFIYSFVGDYALSVFIFLILIRILFVFFDYYTVNQKVKVGVATPFLKIIKQRYLGKDSNKFTDGSMEILKATGASQGYRFIPVFFEYPIIVLIWYVIYHPISVIFPEMRNNMPVLSNIAERCLSQSEKVSSAEYDIINAAKLIPGVFGENAEKLTSINSNLFGRINLFSPASLKSFGLIIPIIIILLYVYKILKLIIPVFKGEKKFYSVRIPLLLYVFVTIFLTVTIFTEPQILYLYLIISLTIGLISGKIFDTVLANKRKPWVVAKNRECQNIIKKYGIDDNISAVKEEIIKECGCE